MKIKTVHIKNFRSIHDQVISLTHYSCFVGPNGAGKSTVLSALNVFFKEQDSSATDTSKLSDEDYFRRNTQDPISITVTFHELSDEAKASLADYVRHDELVVTAEAHYDPAIGFGQVRHCGQRLGMDAFRKYFDASKNNAKADVLKGMYADLRERYPGLTAATTKEAMAESLRKYESEHADECVAIPSEDTFYGINSTGRLCPFVQWIYVPAVKDAGQEGQETKNTAFGKLMARTVRSRVAFDDELTRLKQDALAKYNELLERNRAALNSLSESLQRRLEAWAHPNVRIGIDWFSDPNKSIQVAQPVAGLKTGDGDFIGSLTRMGHGLQRSYLLALLQELASSDAPDAPTLVFACEEPELYQHPPQARHLADVFAQLSHGNSQVLITTHSPYFVSGDSFEDVRLVRAPSKTTGSTVAEIAYEDLCSKIQTVLGEIPSSRREGRIAKIHQALRPHVAEMFFARAVIMVEGLEDSAYITAAMHLAGHWGEFRRLGCHIIPMNGKDKLIQPLAIASEFGIPVFLVFDADGNTTKPEHRDMHERDNKALMKLLSVAEPPFPAVDVIGSDHAIWKSNITATVEADFGAECSFYKDKARLNYAQEPGLDKNELFVADWLAAAYADGRSSASLNNLCDAILSFAKHNVSS